MPGSPSQLFKWASKRSVQRGEEVFLEGERDDALYSNDPTPNPNL